jgi:hypothetical protein
MIHTFEQLSSLVDRVSAYSANHPCASIAEIAVADDPYGFPHLFVGIGQDFGFVQEYWNPGRSTVGDTDAPGKVEFDFAGNTQEIPARQVVPLDTVRAVLGAYLAHGGSIPDGFPWLHPNTND